jgi:signal transduction histidine kinase/CheY-like chemotaxis protein
MKKMPRAQRKKRALGNGHPRLCQKIMPLALCAFLASAGQVRASNQEFGHPLFRSFTPQEFGEFGPALALTEDSQGRMFFGYRNAIAFFDNNRWQIISAPGTGDIRSLATDNRGTVWFSSSTEIGYLAKVASGFRVLRIADGAFGIFSTIVTKDKAVYVSTGDALLVWNNGHLTRLAWPSGSINPTSLALFHGRIAAGDENGFVYQLEENRFEQIAQSTSLHPSQVRAIVDCPSQGGFVVTKSQIFEWIGSRLEPWKSDIDPLLSSSTIFSAKWILDKYLVVLLANTGVYLLDRRGRLVESSTPDRGLGDAGFRAAQADRDGGLWICSDTEITRFQYDEACTEFDHESGLPRGMITAVVRYQGKIYTSTGHGVYVLQTAAESGQAPSFMPFGDRNERMYGIAPTNSTAFAFSNSGTYALNSTTSKLDRIGSGANVIFPSEIDPDRIFLSTRIGLESVHKVNGKWLSEGVLPDFPYTIESLADDEKGDLFISTENDGFYRIQLKENAEPLFAGAKVEPLLDGQGDKIGSGDGGICNWQGRRLFAGSDGVWELKKGSNRLEPFQWPSASLRSRRIFALDRSRLTGDYVWVVSRPLGADSDIGLELGRLYLSGRYEPLSHLITYPLGILYGYWEEKAEEGPVVWIAGDHGLMRVVLDQRPVNQRRFELYASQMVRADGETIPVRDGAYLTLSYDTRDFQIRFGTDRFSASDQLYYHATLQGGLNESLPVTREPVWRSGALNEGKYLLQVQATDSNGVGSKEFVLAFTIEPPWYRTLWMEAAYVAAIVLGFYGFARWRTYQMRVRQRELIRLVDLRTRELREHELKLENAKEVAENAKQAAETAREKAETANRAKTAFLANMSHELRTPINSILGYTQILLRCRHGDANQRSKLKTILSSGGHLLDMINEVLDLSRVESGKVSISLQAVEIPKFIAGVVEEFQLRATRGNLNFIYKIEGSLPQWIETDPLRLRQVLYNLLGNAMKFTAEGSVTLCVYVTAERLRFAVKDTGQGIPPEDLAFLFKPFYQAGNNQLIGQGVGLGLYISKQIVELLGGKIAAVSQPGKGSTFTFEIARTDTKPRGAEVYSRTIVGYEGPRRRILIVDDEALNRALLRELLGMVGFDSVEAGSPAEAFTLLHDPFDAVISDIRMPGQDGHTFCKNLRSFTVTKRLVIIASSASVFADDERQARASGFTDFLPKPILEEELFQILGTHLGLKWIYRSLPDN